MDNKYSKIHICGTNGCGKSTFAKKLSKKLSIPCYDLADVKYKIKFSKQRSEKEMRDRIKQISNKKKWITEECWGERAEELFKKADLIILLKIPKTICQFRVLKRFLTRKGHENDNLKQALRICKKVGNYQKGTHLTSFGAHIQLIKKYDKRAIIIQDSKQLNEFLRRNLK